MASISQNISPTLDHLVNLAHPLYLYPGENPALVLVSPLLTKSNFHQWERDMVVALETKNKKRFIHGTLPCPPITDPLYEAWRKSNCMVMSWLTCSMTPSIKQSVMWMDTTSEIWRDLKDRFSHADKFRISDLQDQILACRRGDSIVSKYYTKLKILWKVMEFYRCVLTCTCLTPCVCGLLSKLHKEREDDYMIRFLRGLNDNYAQVRSQIMILDPMPSIVKTFSMVLQHEREFIDPLPRISTRQRKPPAYLSVYDCPTLSSTNISYSTTYPLHSYLSCSNCSNSHTAFCMSLSATVEPSSFKEAWQHDH
ncbi:uncharacterized protein LOC106765902 [Vigna radiata var. radiata]|uniref:Uncharacterized protein LOC106765902 n=1 Tax=Vigna radiata var. radiata TaxID=3916 RepID=A0A1S3UJF0_VIGRR|nr:uncharacterized protein LOC106765902 [Vigna radiata var. radiata]